MAKMLANAHDLHFTANGTNMTNNANLFTTWLRNPDSGVSFFINRQLNASWTFVAFFGILSSYFTLTSCTRSPGTSGCLDWTSETSLCRNSEVILFLTEETHELYRALSLSPPGVQLADLPNDSVNLAFGTKSKLLYSTAHIMTSMAVDGSDVLVVYGDKDQTVELSFASSSSVEIKTELSVKAQSATVCTTLSEVPRAC